MIGRKFINLFLLFIINISFSVYSNANDLSNNNKYFIKNILVNEIGQDSKEARKKAILSAKRTAFNKMLRNILKEYDENEFSDDQIESIVQAIEYREEKITNKRYKALIDVYFQPEQTMFFIKNKILNKGYSKLKILLIPIFNENGLSKLWQRGNIWRNMLYNMELSEIVSIKIPEGDLDDLSNFKLGKISGLDKNITTKLESLYNVDKIMVSQLHYEYSSIDNEMVLKAYIREIGSNKNILVARSEGEKNEDLNNHLSYLAGKIIANIEKGWVKYNDSLDNANQQDFVIKSKDLSNFIDIKQRLSNMPEIIDFKVNSLSSRYAHITVTFDKNPIEAFELIENSGFSVSRNKGLIILQSR